jgi:hypothetical protein
MATGSSLLTIAAKHIGEKYRLGVIAPKNNPDWKGPWDCAEFCSWVVYRATGKLYGCSTNSDPALADAYTGFWARDANTVGNKIEVAKAFITPGAVLLRVPAPNLIGHIVFSDGEGGTIEAHSTRRGVIRSTVQERRWDMGILLPWVQYTEHGVIMPVKPVVVYRLMDPHMKGEGVKAIQRALRDAGYAPGKIDGDFGPKTTAAAYAFQITKGLTPDGEVGPKTARALKLEWPL